MEGVFIFLLVVGAIILAAGFFCVWVIVTIIRALVRAVTPARKPPTMSDARGVQVCRNPQCGCGNPAHARFCRRCGKSLPSLLRVVSSRAAIL